MKLKVLGSSSSGNCYLLDDGEQILVIETGIPFVTVKYEIDYQTSKIVGALSSHEHMDHRKYLPEYMESGIPVMKGCFKCTFDSMVHTVPGKHFLFGKYEVIPFDVIHDVPCSGYVIKHPDMGTLVFVTDAEYVKYTFPGVNHIMVETNYAQDILDENMYNDVIPKSLRDRIMKSHMSFDTAKDMVKANKNPMLRNVVMCHLSQRNSDRQRFMDEMQEAAGTYCNVTVAKKGMEIDLSLVPF